MSNIIKQILRIPYNLLGFRYLKFIYIKVRNVYQRNRIIIQLKNRPKYFCISMQRTGTTSVGEFFRYCNYKVAGWETSYKNQWTYSWNSGNFEKIFNSIDFKINQVFEDDPWWAPEFYKFLYHRFPGSKFILFTRNPDDWYTSMINHSQGKTLGNTKMHCKIYRRENELNNYLRNNPTIKAADFEIDNLLSIEEHKSHYIEIYKRHNREVIEYFKKYNPDALFICDLDDKDKWIKLSKFIGNEIDEVINIHANKSLI